VEDAQDDGEGDGETSERQSYADRLRIANEKKAREPSTPSHRGSNISVGATGAGGDSSSSSPESGPSPEVAVEKKTKKDDKTKKEDKEKTKKEDKEKTKKEDKDKAKKEEKEKTKREDTDKAKKEDKEKTKDKAKDKTKDKDQRDAKKDEASKGPSAPATTASDPAPQPAPSQPSSQPPSQSQPQPQPVAAVLPIDSHREKILSHVKSFPVTIIHGMTGCGKSSRLPQMLLEDGEQGGVHTQIMVSQPRRIAATALKNRLSQALGPKVGLRLGNGIREESKETRLWFVTTGYLVRFLAHRMESFEKFTHLVVS
jgi:HrpA-like RNA helicase